MIGTLIVQGLLIVIGYCIALMAAMLVAAVAASIAAADLAATIYHSPQSDYQQLVDFTMTSMVVTFATVKQSLAPSFIAMALAEFLRIRRLVTYLLAGCLIGLFTALPIDAYLAGTPVLPLDTTYLRVAVASSAVGAFFYWLIAGRSAGRWLETEPPRDPRA